MAVWRYATVPRSASVSVLARVACSAFRSIRKCEICSRFLTPTIMQRFPALSIYFGRDARYNYLFGVNNPPPEPARPSSPCFTLSRAQMRLATNQERNRVRMLKARRRMESRTEGALLWDLAVSCVDCAVLAGGDPKLPRMRIPNT